MIKITSMILIILRSKLQNFRINKLKKEIEFLKGNNNG